MAAIRDEASVVILTCDRPDDLVISMKSVLQQDPLPGEIVVVDDGSIRVEPIRSLVESAGVRLVYHKKDRRGISRSRNIGARLAGGSLIMYLDDDQVMEPGYMQAVLDAFDADTEGCLLGVGAVFRGGETLRPGRLDPLWHVLERFFLLRGTGHRVLISGFSSPQWQGYEAPQEVSFLSGCASYRRAVFDSNSFDEELEAFGPYAFGEDLAFSFKVGRQGRLLITPRASVLHHRSATSRPATADMARLRLYNQYYIYSRYFRPDAAKPPAFAWAVTGKAVLGALKLVVRPGRESWRHLRGTLSGAWLVTKMALTGGFRPLRSS